MCFKIISYCKVSMVLFLKPLSINYKYAKIVKVCEMGKINELI